MAERRMFTLQIVDSDAFQDMPLSAQALYFHLGMKADDDGFLGNPKRVQRMIGASEDDMKLLLMKNFIYLFDTGICVIKHWKMHNYIQKDRYKPTAYELEKSMLELKQNKAYTVKNPSCIQNGYILDTTCTPRLGKDRLGKVSIVEDSKRHLNNINNACVSPFPDVEKQLEEKEQEQQKLYGTPIIELYEERFNRLLSQRELQIICQWKEEYDDKLLRYAFREMLVQDKNSVDYVDRILLDWKKRGLTAEQYEGGER
ncbi:DnaD domain-containing protein [[Clostridium] innocuum]|uniref:DnaD domain-containing protein n=1 Tax=Clostridium innocuum TaxID=1522 RepID=UPI0022E50775|nr:DnaD domain protein [[Clostridium] innocuum]